MSPGWQPKMLHSLLIVSVSTRLLFVRGPERTLSNTVPFIPFCRKSHFFKPLLSISSFTFSIEIDNAITPLSIPNYSTLFVQTQVQFCTKECPQVCTKCQFTNCPNSCAIQSVRRGNPDDKKSAAPVVETGTAERRHTIMTLRKQGGTWYANGKPYASLHEAIEALRG